MKHVLMLTVLVAAAGLQQTDPPGQAAGAAARIIDLAGAFALPGFSDAHVHVDSTGGLLVGANLLDVHAPAPFTARIRDAAARPPKGSWITRPRLPAAPDTVVRSPFSSLMHHIVRSCALS